MPDWSRKIQAAIATLNLGPIREAQVVEELSQHIQDQYEEMLAGGVKPDLAYRRLVSDLNDGTLLKGLKATVRSEPAAISFGRDDGDSFFSSLLNDLRYGARLLRMNPGFAIVAILSLALGIGANTTIFQLLDAVRLRTLQGDFV